MLQMRCNHSTASHQYFDTACSHASICVGTHNVVFKLENESPRYEVVFGLNTGIANGGQ